MSIAFKLASLHAAGSAEAGYHMLAGFLCICHHSYPLDSIHMIALHKVKLKCKLTYSPCFGLWIYLDWLDKLKLITLGIEKLQEYLGKQMGIIEAGLFR